MKKYEMILKKKIKGGALLYAVFISIVILVILSLIYLISTHINFQINNLLNFEQLKSDIHSAFVYYEHNPDILTKKSEIEIDLFNDKNSIVKLRKEPWGAYAIVHISAATNRQEIKKSALFGSYTDPNDRITLQLANTDDCLYLIGNTKITGKAYLPKLGIRSGNIEGQSYQGMEYVKGEINTGKKDFPIVSQKKIEEIESHVYNSQRIRPENIFNESILSYKDSLSNSFQNDLLIIHLNNDYRIIRKIIRGKICIVSNGKIEISSSCQLEDIMIMANEVVIESGFSGCLQIFASRLIDVEENCNLNFPSLLMLNSDQKYNDPQIIIRSSCHIKGEVIVLSNTSMSQNRIHAILMEPESIVEGLVYTNKIAEIQGKVLGSVICSKFQLTTSNSIYYNYLKDAELNSNDLSTYFINSLIIDDSQKLKKIKWLY